MASVYGEDFIRMIQTFCPSARPVSGRREIVMRCKECGDSANIKHAHLYINVPQTPDEMSMYHCKKCMASGIVDDKFLRRYGCDDIEYLSEMSKQVKAILSSPKYAALRLSMGQSLNNSFISDRPTNEKKLEYINTRLGSNFTFQDLGRLKIFLNLTDVLYSNNLNPTMYEKDIRELDEHFIGFIGFDNTRAIMRRYDNSISNGWIKDYRYINYNFVSNKTSKTFYVIPTTVDLESTEHTNIHIAEGVFDILSVFYNLNHCNSKQNVYISASGKSYRQALEFILTTIGVIYYKVHYYPDADVSDREFQSVLIALAELPTDVYVHRNLMQHQKDFGVPMAYIREGVTIQYEKEI